MLNGRGNFFKSSTNKTYNNSNVILRELMKTKEERSERGGFTCKMSKKELRGVG